LRLSAAVATDADSGPLRTLARRMVVADGMLASGVA
jgi:hypothetical protein